jgi:hypothetical protein
LSEMTKRGMMIAMKKNRSRSIVKSKKYPTLS